MDPREALVALGTLVGFLEAGSGTVRWTWLGAPGENTLTGIVENRDQLHDLISQLTGSTDGAATFDASGRDWEPVLNAGPATIGLVWNAVDEDAPQPLPPLALGLGMTSTSVGLSLLAGLLEVDGVTPSVASSLGEITLAGTAPVPDGLLSGATFEGSLPASGPPRLALKVVVDLDDEPHVLDSDSKSAAWDCIRMATVVLKAITRGAGEETLLGRADEHLFAMLGDPEGPIGALPPVDAMQTPPSFSAWSSSVLPTATPPDFSGAMTFLWHARALLTGNESGQFIEGSRYLPVLPAADGQVVDSSFQLTSKLPPGTEPKVPGVYVGLQADDTSQRQIVLVGVSNAIVAPSTTTIPVTTMRVVLARVGSDGNLRPASGSSSLPALITANQSWTIDPAAGTTIKTAANGSGGHTVTLTTGTAATLELLVDGQGAVTYRLPETGLEIAPPASGAAGVLAAVMTWVFGGIPGGEEGHEPGLRAALEAMFEARRADPSGPSAAQSLAVVAAMLNPDASSPGVASGTVGPLSYDLTASQLALGLTLGPIAPGPDDDVPVHIGKAVITATRDLAAGGSDVSAFSVALTDVRVGPAGLPGGFAASLLPDLRQVPGFRLALAWKPAGLTLEGGGRIPVQARLGPLEVGFLVVDLDDPAWLSIAVDVGFHLSAIKVSAAGLGVRFPLTGAKETEVFLHGLGVSLDISAVKIRGMFLAVPGAGAVDYVGGAVISVAGLFDLTAIGGYSQLPPAQTAGAAPDADASLFIFASLNAPLGGPPFFFVTGIAGGFGYNRSLPATGPVAEIEQHPFFQVMNGDLDIGGGASDALQKLGAHFHPSPGEHWVAGAVAFTSFGFIEGKILVAVAFGHEFSIEVLGVASFSVKPIAYFEVGLHAIVDAERALVEAAISPNSYFICPEFFSLRGGVGLEVWHGGPNAGDFVLSIGGYHPLFDAPKHYPHVDRVGVSVSLGIVKLSVECFFACTPKALMAGASLSLSVDLAIVSAGLDAYVDVLIQWDPFSIWARVGIDVWFVFLGRHTVSVDLVIHTPPFGGVAVVDLTLISFTVRFGDQGYKEPVGLPLAALFDEHLEVPATGSALHATVNAFNTADAAGLFRIDVTSGQAAAEKDQPQPASSKQQGLTAGTALKVEAEFELTILTRLPFRTAPQDADANADDVEVQPVAIANGAVALSGHVSLALCRLEDLASTLTISGLTKAASPDQSAAAPRALALADWFPDAVFGAVLPVGDEIFAAIGEGHRPTLALADGARVRYEWRAPSAALIQQVDRELPDEGQSFPLPLGKAASLLGARQRESGLIFTRAVAGAGYAPPAAKRGRRDEAMRALARRVSPPIRMRSRTADSERMTVATHVRTTTVRSPLGVPVMAPAPSPARRPEMFAVSLRVLPMRSALPVVGDTLVGLRRARNVAVQEHARAERGAPVAATVTLGAGKVAQIDVEADGLRQAVLHAEGLQTVRALMLGGGGDLIGDVHLTGASMLELGVRVRRVVLVGEGMNVAVLGDDATAEDGSPVAAEPVGVEHDTVLLALTRTTFAAHGCVLQSHAALPFTAEPLDSVPAATLLRAATRLTLHVPRATARSSLVLTIAPTVAEPGSAVDGVRWRSEDATLSDLDAVPGPHSTALVMAVASEQPWALELDFGPNWRLTGAHISPLTASDVASRLRSGAELARVDDRLSAAPPGTSTEITMEVLS